jgi:uncharacterized membrane protein YkvA (DUF1232 family)
VATILWLLVGVVVALVVCWAVLAVLMLRLNPGEASVRETLRLVPDVIRLTKRLAKDPTLPRGLRIRLWLLLGYLVCPIDLIPDFVPVIGYADDAIIVTVVLRSVVRAAGTDALARHWPGSPDGLAALARAAGLAA